MNSLKYFQKKNYVQFSFLNILFIFFIILKQQEMIRHVGSLPISKTLKEKLIKNGVETINDLNDMTVLDLNRCKFYVHSYLSIRKTR